MAIVDLQPGQAVHGVVGTLFDVREEDHPVAGGYCFQQFGERLLHFVEDGFLRIQQAAPDLGARNEQHAVFEPAPAAVDEIARRTKMIGEQDGADAGLFRVREHLGQGAAGVIGILGMRMEDAAVIVQAGHRHNPGALRA